MEHREVLQTIVEKAMWVCASCLSHLLNVNGRREISRVFFVSSLEGATEFGESRERARDMKYL